MKTITKWMPRGLMCLIILGIIFGYMASVMGLTNMLNTIMKTAHDLLLNTVFYLMGMCVITGALGKILVEFGAVDLLQRLLRPVMKPLFNMPGVASLGAVLTFLSDNPAIIALSQDKAFARYFKKYQHVSLVNFGTAFGMGLLVIIFMMGQGYYAEPFIGLFGAICGCIVSTRTMQYLTCKKYPEFRTQNAVSELDSLNTEENELDKKDQPGKQKQSMFIRILNSLLDGGKDGVTIGLAIIPGVLIISTFVMMMTFGGSSEGIDPATGSKIVVYTGDAYQGTQLLPWLAGKISFVFKWLFGFTAPELVAFPITALGAVGAALGLIPEFMNKGIIDGNAIAVCTAMGMCWSGYLSTDAATLDSLGYRPLVPRALLSTFLGGIFAGIFTHWVYVGFAAMSTFFAPHPVWEVNAEAFSCMNETPTEVRVTALNDSSFTIKDWFGETGTDLTFKVNKKDSTLHITNAYGEKDGQYFWVRINNKAQHGEPAYAVIYPVEQQSEFDGNEKSGYMYAFTFIYDGNQKIINRGYYEVVWGDSKRQTIEAEEQIQKMQAQERIKAEQVADSIQRAELIDSILQSNQ